MSGNKPASTPLRPRVYFIIRSNPGFTKELKVYTHSPFIDDYVHNVKLSDWLESTDGIFHNKKDVERFWVVTTDNKVYNKQVDND